MSTMLSHSACSRVVAERVERVAAPLERDQSVRSHALVVRQRETRRLEVDEVHRAATAELLDLADAARRCNRSSFDFVYSICRRWRLPIAPGLSGLISNPSSGMSIRRRQVRMQHVVDERRAVRRLGPTHREQLEQVRLARRRVAPSTAQIRSSRSRRRRGTHTSRNALRARRSCSSREARRAKLVPCGRFLDLTRAASRLPPRRRLRSR